MKSVNVLLQQVKRITLLSDSTTLIYVLYGSTTSAWPTTSFHHRVICCPPACPTFPHTAARHGIQDWSSVQDQTICKLRQDVSVNSHFLTALPGFVVCQRYRCLVSSTASRPPVGPSQRLCSYPESKRWRRS